MAEFHTYVGMWTKGNEALVLPYTALTLASRRQAVWLEGATPSPDWPQVPMPQDLARALCTVARRSAIAAGLVLIQNGPAIRDARGWFVSIRDISRPDSTAK